MSIKDNIYKLRTAHRLSQTGLAKKIGVSPQAVQKWEQGLSTPSRRNAAKAADALGVTPAELLYGRQDNAQDTRLKEVEEMVRQLSDRNLDIIYAALKGILAQRD